MSNVNYYRNNIERKTKELLYLKSKIANEEKKKNNYKEKINQKTGYLMRNKNISISTLNPYQRDMSNYQKEITKLEKNINDLTLKIINKEKEINLEKNKLTKEEEKERNLLLKKQDEDRERNLRAQYQTNKIIMNDLNSINKVVNNHTDILNELVKPKDTIKVLLFSANPIKTSQLRLDEEIRTIEEEIRKTDYRENIKFEAKLATRVSDIFLHINSINPDIIHFSGHGCENGDIVIEDTDGHAKLISAELMSEMIKTTTDNVSLILFNSCYSNMQAESASKIILASIGMKDSIGDKVAIMFAAQFYSSIGFGMSLEKSFKQAITRLKIEFGEEQSNIPELYLNEDVNADNIVFIKKLCNVG